MNVSWLYEELDRRGLTMRALKEEHHFSPDNIYKWAKGLPPMPSTLRKLAGILKMEYEDLVKRLAVKPMTRMALAAARVGSRRRGSRR